MGLLKKGKKKKPLKTGRGASSAAQSALRPTQVVKLPPCTGECPSGNDIRGWLTTIAQREKLGLSEDEAFEKAWRIICETNPFPSIMGRVCPHPCETRCNREGKDGAVSINCMERFIGDWGLEKKLGLTKIEGEEQKSESLGVIGAGPAGLSFAYQMARRGYPVTVYDKYEHAGGMLYYGIPFYRLPADVMKAEFDRIEALGVEIKLGCEVGKDITLDELKQKHQAIFLGIGAHKGKLMRVEGEEGPGVWTGTDYLRRVAMGETVDVGKSVVVIGGGDTAIDAARIARRTGADVTILYRRTRVEMPAIDSEVEDAFKEDVKIEFLVLPVGVVRNGDALEAIKVQRMELGEPDSSGRRRPVPIEGTEYTIAVSTIIAAISQEPDWGDITDLGPKKRWLEADENYKVKENAGDVDNVWTGGDALDLGIATTAVLHGRLAADDVHAALRSAERPHHIKEPPIPLERIKLEHYDPKDRTKPTHRPVEEWLTKPDDEITHAISQDQFVEEAGRCFSCGLCMGCEKCWMYCTPSCFVKVPTITHGNYYTIKLEVCDGCKKCADECPCGYLDMI